MIIMPVEPCSAWCHQVETLLSALGRSDNAASAMKVLGPHAGKVKQAKEAAAGPRIPTIVLETA